MTRYLNISCFVRQLSFLCLSAGLVISTPLLAGTVNLATAPLANASTSSVLPNLMFILDDSGSMGDDYLPDWIVDGNYCKIETGKAGMRCCLQPDKTHPVSSSGANVCLGDDSVRAMPLFDTADFNKIYYDPRITYSVPVDYSGTNKTSYDGTTAVPLDGYGKQTTATLIPASGYPDLEWCIDTAYTDCLRNDNYLLPGTVNGKAYTTMHATTASGLNKSFATGSVSAPTTVVRNVGPFYYVMVPGEYCSDVNLTTCISATTASTTYPFPAKTRWCSDSALTTCRAIQDAAYKYVRYPTIVSTGTAGANSTGKLTVASMPKGTNTGTTSAICGSSGVTVSSIKLNGVELLASSITYCSNNNNQNTRNTNLAAQIQSNIGNGFIASASGSVLTVTAPDGTYNGAVFSANLTTATLTNTSVFSGGVPSVAAVTVPGAWQRVDIVSGQTYGNIVVGGQTIVDRSQRTDCSSKPNCTYNEELRNFSNWMAWYHTRMQMMKTSASRAFKIIDNRYRVGFINIHNGSYLKISTFTAGAAGQKFKWYEKLFNSVPSGGTPLRSSLATVGRIFAGQNPLGIVGGDDPMQYSCQQNFSMLTTDGYWNTDSSGDVKDLNGSALGNMDSVSTDRPHYEGPTASSGSLADVAKYYYEADLRSTTLVNCVGALGAGTDVCADNVFVSGTDNNRKQHMTTFTLGLGVDGTLQYVSDYQTATSGDYYNISKGAGTPHDWPVPVANTSTAIDDLWHAAVNGGGTYFSAKDPTQLSSSLNDALASIDAKLGSGSAAATSTLNPVNGDNFAYVASYTTVKWLGNLEARGINLINGTVSKAATWCAEDVVAGTCAEPSIKIADFTGGSTAYRCVTPSSTALTCGGVFDAINQTCSVQLSIACTGTMATKVGSTSDTRNIKFNSGGVLTDFTYGNLNAAGKSSLFLSGNLLSQWAILDATQKSAANGINLVNYLRGQTGFEDRTSNPASNRLFRARDATLGDLVDSQPFYLGKPFFHYADAGYSSFITSNVLRDKTVYVGANDGMLHAFNAVDGTERWAYVPSMVMPSLWKLADKNYASMHAYSVNGKPVVADIYNGSTWRTILVAGLNGGGRGYYALDITNPVSPTLLWEIDSNTDSDIGYSFGPPVITKDSAGSWVVLLSSGYNNVSPGTGGGYVFVRNALTGANIRKISTGVGSTTTPSGLGKLASWADYPDINNTSVYVYGGDFEGNVWRFDINAGTAKLFAVLKDSGGTPQPITTTPELGLINGKRVIFVGTGKYLEITDLTNTQQQTLYAIKDDNSPTTLDNPRTSLVQQTLTGSGATRTTTTNAVNFTTGLGWYTNLPDSGERINVDLTLDSGTLFAPSTVPSDSACSPGGSGWLNYFNYSSGNNGLVTAIVSQIFNAPIVGVNIFYTPDGRRVVAPVTADNPTPQIPKNDIPQPTVNTSFVGKRLIWREFIP